MYFLSSSFFQICKILLQFPSDLLFCFYSKCRGSAPISAKPTDMAFLLHTSGTTSTPKLVPITHEAVVANLNGLVSTYGLSSADVALHVLPFFHVAGIVIGLMSTLAAGGCVVINPTFDPLAFPQLLRKHQVTWFTAVPAMFKAFLEHKGLFEAQVWSCIFDTVTLQISFKQCLTAI